MTEYIRVPCSEPAVHGTAKLLRDKTDRLRPQGPEDRRAVWRAGGLGRRRYRCSKGGGGDTIIKIRSAAYLCSLPCLAG
jgi:hypothetical protein